MHWLSAPSFGDGATVPERFFRQDPGKHAAGTNVSRKSLRWDWRLEAPLNRKANGLALEGPFCGTLRTFVGLTPKKLLESIPRGGDLAGLRDRALISTMLFSFARISAVLSLKRQDFYYQGPRR